MLHLSLKLIKNNKNKCILINGPISKNFKENILYYRVSL